MNWRFGLGVIAGCVLMIKIQFLAIVLLLVAGHFIELEVITNTLAVIMVIIMIFGHMKTSIAMHRDFFGGIPEENILEPKTIEEALDITRDPVFKGIAWRFKREWKYIKEVASFNFKYND